MNLELNMFMNYLQEMIYTEIVDPTYLYLKY